MSEMSGRDIESARARDRWAQWLLEGRHGGDPELRRAILPELERWRDLILARARVRRGDILLDVGTGDGLIAFGAIELVGPTGKVVFSDISGELLDHCRALVGELGLDERCSFVVAGAEDLGPIEDSSIDVVTTRSVLIYVQNKPMALAEFLRVLRPGGRISLMEPINRLIYPEPPNQLLGFDVTPVRDLADKIKAEADKSLGLERTLLDFDDRDLVTMAEAGGFKEIHLDLEFQIVTERLPLTWESLMGSSGNPLMPSNGELVRAALTASEIQRFEAHVKPVVESGSRQRRSAMAHLWAERP